MYSTYSKKLDSIAEEICEYPSVAIGEAVYFVINDQTRGKLTVYVYPGSYNYDIVASVINVTNGVIDSVRIETDRPTEETAEKIVTYFDMFSVR